MQDTDIVMHMNRDFKTVRSLVKRILTEVKRVREADITGDKKTTWGSPEHIKDLEKRISDALYWRNKSRKGSEQRANYARVVNSLKQQLASAKRAAEKQ